MNNKLGLLHIYCGDGKGKTTAALGLAMRAAGRRLRVVVAQFLKSADTGELHAFENVENVTILRSSEKFPFTFQMDDTQKERLTRIHNEIFEEALRLCEGKEALLVLDELIGAYNSDLIDRERVDGYLFSAHEGVETVLTGRNPPDAFVERADYVSEIRKIKHPFDRKIPARKGIEM